MDYIEVKEAVEEALDKEREAAVDYAEGKEGAENYLIGTVLQKVGGSVPPEGVAEVLDDVVESVDYPISFTTYRRPFDRVGLAEKMGSNTPPWFEPTVELEDPSKYNIGFEVQIYSDGSMDIDVVDGIDNDEE